MHHISVFRVNNKRIFVYTFCRINICLSLSDDANKIKTVNIERVITVLVFFLKFESNSSNGFGEVLFQKLEIFQRMYGSLTFLPPSNFAGFVG